MGYRLVPNDLPQWLTVSRPYYQSQVAVFTADAADRAFADIAPGDGIGARMGGTGHRELRMYLDALPPERRPRQIPYPDNKLLLDRLADGTLQAVLIWELAPYFATGGALQRLHIAARFAPPFPTPPLQFSVAVLKQNAFIRTMIDEAISGLETTGALAAIARDLLPH